MKKNNKVIFLTQAAMIAALYVVLTLLAAAFGLSSGVIQVRFSEALTVLAFFTPAAIPGLFIGCILANWLTGALLWDIVFGSLATLVAAVFTYLLRKNKWLAPIPPIVSNTVVVPLILKYVYELEGTIPFLCLRHVRVRLSPAEFSECFCCSHLKGIKTPYSKIIDLKCNY